MNEILDLIINNIGIVSAGVFSLLTLIFGVKIVSFKTKFSQVVELLVDVREAMKDNKISKEELDEIIADIKAILEKKE